MPEGSFQKSLHGNFRVQANIASNSSSFSHTEECVYRKILLALPLENTVPLPPPWRYLPTSLTRITAVAPTWGPQSL